jgi:hypothetical protein
VTTARRAAATIPTAACRQTNWTRLGRQMGYTDSKPKRSAIRAAVARMTWVDPCQHADALDASPVRTYVDALFDRRREALYRAAVIDLSPDAGLSPGPGGHPRLIGLWSLTGERHVLLDLGYEALNLMRDTVREEARP